MSLALPGREAPTMSRVLPSLASCVAPRQAPPSGALADPEDPVAPDPLDDPLAPVAGPAVPLFEPALPPPMMPDLPLPLPLLPVAADDCGGGGLLDELHPVRTSKPTKTSAPPTPSKRLPMLDSNARSVRRRKPPRAGATPACTTQCACGGAGTHSPIMQLLGAMQSTFVWQGNAHLPYCTLQWCVPHGTSFWH